MDQGENNSTSSSQVKVDVMNLGQGCCIMIVVIVVLPYMVNMIYTLGSSIVNQIKWHQHGSPNYTISVSEVSFSPLSGDNIVTVREGKIITAKRGENVYEPGNVGLDMFKEVTIEEMFARTYSCAFFFPFFTCSYKYHPYYGYPTDAVINCPIMDACFSSLYIYNVDLILGTPTASVRTRPPLCTSYPIGYGDQNISDLAIDADGAIWVANYGNGVFRYNAEQDKWINYTNNDGLISNDVYSITPLDNGSIWFATEGGASLWNGVNWSSYNEKNGLINNSVFKVAQGSDQSYWFATQKGASRFYPDSNSWTNYTVKDGLADNFVDYVTETSDGSIWLATLDGLSRLILSKSPNEKAQWITYSRFNHRKRYIPDDSIDEIQVAQDGMYWFSTSGGLLQFNPVSNNWDFSKSSLNNGCNINSFTFGKDGSIWVAAGYQAPIICHLNHLIKWEVYNDPDWLSPVNKLVSKSQAVAMAIDKNDNVWIATEKYVSRCVFPNK